MISFSRMIKFVSRPGEDLGSRFTLWIFWFACLIAIVVVIYVAAIRSLGFYGVGPMAHASKDEILRVIYECPDTRSSLIRRTQPPTRGNPIHRT